MVILCEECNYYIENKCRHFGKTDPGQQREKNIRGCDKDRTSINEIHKHDSVKKDLLWQELLELHKQYIQIDSTAEASHCNTVTRYSRF